MMQAIRSTRSRLTFYKLMRLVISSMCLVGMGAVLAQTATPTAPPDAVATVPGEAQPDATEAVRELDPLLNLLIAPPLAIDLPDGWQFGYDTIIYEDVDGRVENAQVALYTGPIDGQDTTGNPITAQGWIVLVWGYDSVTNPFSVQTDMGSPWLDGQRILRLLLFSNECVLGLAPQRPYTINEIEATGTQFSAVQCPEGEPDTRGWFAAAQIDGVNFAFYMYADPLQPPDSGFEFALQAILDTVEFNVDERVMSPEQIDATREAILSQTPTATP